MDCVGAQAAKKRRAGEAVLVGADGCRTAAKLWFCVVRVESRPILNAPSSIRVG